MNWLEKLEKRIGKFYIPNLMLVITVGTLIAYAFAFINPSILSLINLNPQKVLEGEIWRLITFVFVPEGTSSIFFIITVYFYYLAGSTLEKVWGGFKFNVYYFIGAISTIIISFIAKVPVSGSFINLSLFLAFAKIYPDMQVRLFFMIPIKMKYLAYFNWLLIIVGALRYVFMGEFVGVLYSLVPIVNYLVFFGPSSYKQTKMRRSSVIRMKDYQKKVKAAKKDYTHKCTVCGITDIDNPNMEFRYCSKCNGKYAYCSNHTLNHKHIE